MPPRETDEQARGGVLVGCLGDGQGEGKPDVTGWSHWGQCDRTRSRHWERWGRGCRTVTVTPPASGLV